MIDQENTKQVLRIFEFKLNKNMYDKNCLNMTDLDSLDNFSSSNRPAW